MARHDLVALHLNARTLEVEFSQDELAGIAAELPDTAGTRYDEAGMSAVNV